MRREDEAELQQARNVVDEELGRLTAQHPAAGRGESHGEAGLHGTVGGHRHGRLPEDFLARRIHGDQAALSRAAIAARLIGLLDEGAGEMRGKTYGATVRDAGPCRKRRGCRRGEHAESAGRGERISLDVVDEEGEPGEAPDPRDVLVGFVPAAVQPQYQLLEVLRITSDALHRPLLGALPAAP